MFYHVRYCQCNHREDPPLELTLLPADLSGPVMALLLAASVATSLMTAALGAGGGLALLVLMAIWIPPQVLIPVHGLIQLGSNAGRATLAWQHINWRIIAAFLPGVVIGAWLGAQVLIQLPEALWQLSIAAFVLWLCWGPPLPKLAFGHVGVALAAFITTFVSLFVGATGPLVAAFIKQIPQSRFATVATFATAMVLQHAPKALVFGVLGFAFVEWVGFIGLMIAAGFIGTQLGLRLLRRFTDQRFQRWFNLVLTLLALRLIWQALVG